LPEGKIACIAPLLLLRRSAARRSGGVSEAHEHRGADKRPQALTGRAVQLLNTYRIIALQHRVAPVENRRMGLSASVARS
jgi:hypothetical protein